MCDVQNIGFCPSFKQKTENSTLFCAAAVKAEAVMWPVGGARAPSRPAPQRETSFTILTALHHLLYIIPLVLDLVMIIIIIITIISNDSC